METEKTLNKTMESYKTFKWALLFSVLLSAIVGLFLYSAKVESDALTKRWTDLKSKSEAHDVIISSYRDCRERVFGGSPGECQMTALNYGKARGFESSQVVFNEIVNLSGQIALEISQGN